MALSSATNPFDQALVAVNANVFWTAPPGFSKRQVVLITLQALTILADVFYLGLLHYTQRSSEDGNAGPGMWWVARWVNRSTGRIMVVNQRTMSTVLSALAQGVWMGHVIDHLLLYTGGDIHTLDRAIVWRAITIVFMLGWFWVLTWGNVTSFVLATHRKIPSRVVNTLVLAAGLAPLIVVIVLLVFMIVRGMQFRDVYVAFAKGLRSNAAAYPNVTLAAYAEIQPQAAALVKAANTYYHTFCMMATNAVAYTALSAIINFGGLLLARKIKHQIKFNEKLITSGSRAVTQQGTLIVAGHGNVGEPQAGDPISRMQGGGVMAGANVLLAQRQEQRIILGLKRARRDVLTMFAFVLCFSLIVSGALLFVTIVSGTSDPMSISWAKSEMLFTGPAWAIMVVMLAAQLGLIWNALTFRRKERGTAQMFEEGSTGPVASWIRSKGNRKKIIRRSTPETLVASPVISGSLPRSETGQQRACVEVEDRRRCAEEIMVNLVRIRDEDEEGKPRSPALMKWEGLTPRDSMDDCEKGGQRGGLETPASRR
ncbi:BZ3500_MvSof-1268-A1-R1_Chr10-1g02642 [Microbotryum saponariae]|uniref:BZ3500_MvSof-1268-A1-R1_Chr10-1g02642 protein n=1 Tax=Microbotryum saponariae TaxID=289078 RepID=A0A2X0L4B0_9BASI|nr:BZ3500_MvSof-1268-A1-R1_Chr10-1g02642 [Microbotryum saponariae]SDA06131.1 BZ3501_MvSof-1269-A2-R1_Chr10-1g02243 [Microbotryum saponariae]